MWTRSRYRINLAAPVSFHDLNFARILKEGCRAGGENENSYRTAGCALNVVYPGKTITIKGLFLHAI